MCNATDYTRKVYYREFNHEFQATEGSGTPGILGVDFWQKLKAVFDFGSRLITLTMPDGTREQIEFTIGDERANEEVMQVYCVEDVVVPPRAAYLLKGSVGTAAQKVKLTLHDTWMVEARSKGDEEELESEAVAAVEAAQAARDAFSAKRR